MSNEVCVSVDGDKVTVSAPASVNALLIWRTLRTMHERALFSRKHGMVYGAVSQDEVDVLKYLCESAIKGAQRSANEERNAREIRARADDVDAKHARKSTTRSAGHRQDHT